MTLADAAQTTSREEPRIVVVFRAGLCRPRHGQLSDGQIPSLGDDLASIDAKPGADAAFTINQ